MHFYRTPGTIHAISFDLDNTLYDNYPVILQAETQTALFLKTRYPTLSLFTLDDFRRGREALLQQQPEIYHDVTYWRFVSMVHTLQEQGIDHHEAIQGSQAAMQVFAHWRSQIAIPQATHHVLQALAQRYPLVAISNGNADPARCDLAPYFHFVLRSGPDGRAKPYSDMFLLAAQRLKLAPEHILHVGDDLKTDVAGALQCGMQSCWINAKQCDLMLEPRARLLPHMEISQLASLTALL